MNDVTQLINKLGPRNTALIAIGGGLGLLFLFLLVTAPDVIGGILGALMIGVVILLVIAAWSAPIWIAFQRRHSSAVAITLVCLIFGWTFIGWVIALVWALSNPGHAAQQTVVINQAFNTQPTNPVQVADLRTPQQAPAPAQLSAYPPPQAQLPQYQVGDVVNGHRYNGVEWTPVH